MSGLSFANGDVTVTVATFVPKFTVIAASPWPDTVASPCSSTAATSSSLDPNRAHRVTSSVVPSE